MKDKSTHLFILNERLSSRLLLIKDNNHKTD